MLTTLKGNLQIGILPFAEWNNLHSIPTYYCRAPTSGYSSNSLTIFSEADAIYRVYNSENRLWKIHNGTNESAPVLQEFTWDLVDDRILMKTTFYGNGSWKEKVIYVMPEMVRVKNDSGTFEFLYVYHEGQLVAQRNPDGSKLYFHPDHLGSTTLVTNQNAQAIENTSFEPFGFAYEGGTVSRLDYEAKEYDPIVKDLDFHFRMQGIAGTPPFSQPDNIIPNPYNPQNLNRYSFENNNPYGQVDPAGHEGLISQASDDNVKSPMKIGAHVLEIWNKIDMGREWAREDTLDLYEKSYGPSPDVLHPGGLRTRGGPSYGDLKEWAGSRVRSDGRTNPNIRASFEKSGTITTQNTQSFSSAQSALGGIYASVANQGGVVNVRDRGIITGVMGVYGRETSGKTVLRYQVFENEKERKSWEKKNKQYKTYSTKAPAKKK